MKVMRDTSPFTCDLCDKEHLEIVSLETDMGCVWLCRDCLRAALDLLEKEAK